jgi:KDO2-lipid IV(A) lauroyltransferase
VRTLGDALVYGGFRVLWAILGALPLSALRRLLEALGRLVWLVDHRHREIVAQNLTTAFPDWPPARVKRVERSTFANWGRIAAELIRFDEIAARRGPDDPTIQALKRASQPLLARRRGLIVLTAHTGNFELLARLWGRATGVEIAVFHRAMRNRFIDRFLQAERAACAFRVVARGSAVREALRILERGGVFVVPLDQNQLPGRGVFVDLFGRPASTTTLLARLAEASGAPVLPVFAAWEGSNTIGLIFDPMETNPPDRRAPRSGRDDVLREMTAEYTAKIEMAIRRYPEQWNWAHRRWKTRPK